MFRSNRAKPSCWKPLTSLVIGQPACWTASKNSPHSGVAAGPRCSTSGPAALQHRLLVRWIRGQPVGERAARRAAADDDVVVSLVHVPILHLTTTRLVLLHVGLSVPQCATSLVRERRH